MGPFLDLFDYTNVECCVIMNSKILIIFERKKIIFEYLDSKIEMKQSIQEGPFSILGYIEIKPCFYDLKVARFTCFTICER